MMFSDYCCILGVNSDRRRRGRGCCALSWMLLLLLLTASTATDAEAMLLRDYGTMTVTVLDLPCEYADIIAITMMIIIIMILLLLLVITTVSREVARTVVV